MKKEQDQVLQAPAANSDKLINYLPPEKGDSDNQKERKKKQKTIDPGNEHNHLGNKSKK